VIEPSGRVLFRILGPVEAWTGEDWATITAAKQRSLLATLLVHAGQPVSTDALAEEVWPGEPPAKPSSLLSVYMHHLRRLTGDADGRVLVTRPPGYQVVLGRGELDADRFTRLVAMGRQALADGAPSRAVDLLTEALGLWRGQALADVFPTQLIEAEARRLEESRVEALELRAEASLACGRYAEVIPELRRLLADQPMREKLWALLMRALYGAGRQAEALEMYEEARRRIADELGVDPGPELRQLHQQILDADSEGTLAALGPPAVTQASSPAYQPPAQLPADITDFTGRTGQVKRLRGLLTDAGADGTPGAVRVALVVGAGGLGKTTLAVHAAHLLASEFPDGQLYANLHGAAQPADPAEVLARFLRALGTEPANIPLGEEERSAHYRTRLAGKKVLIVLDDARDAAQVRPLLPGSASCAVLVTARRRLPELPGTKVLDLDVLPLDEARTLFVLVAGQERAVAEPAATDDVLAACAGLPLAIRIGGARLAARGNWTVRALADRLSDERRRLDELRAGNLAVRASFEVSFASLPGPEVPDGVEPARAFRLLGLWTGSSVSLVAASALLGEERFAVSDALDVLVDAHLLETRALDQYRFHDLLRVYAADRARIQETEQDRQAAVGRLLSWYLHTTAAAAAVISPQHTQVPLEPPPPMVHPLSFTSFEEALAWCEAERAGLTAATRLAATYGLHELAWKLPAAAMSFYFRRSYWNDWITTHDIGLSSARALDDPLAQAWMFNNLGMAYGQQRMPEAVRYFEQALELYRQIADLRGVARAEYNLANASFDLGRYAEALEAAERSLPIQRQLGNRYVEGLALNTMGCASRELGRSSEAVDHFQQAMAIFRDLGDVDSVADSLSDLGDTYLGLRRFDEAIVCLEQSLAIRRDLKDRAGQAATLARLGHAHRGAGDLRQASEFLAEAQRLEEELGDHAKAAEVHAALSDLTNEDD
jgi:DNA-binding SARP family transcriptional activator